MLSLVVLFALSGLLLVVLSIPMMRGKVPPNAWYGVRLPATMKDEQLWHDANVFAGKCLLVAGVVWIASALVFSQIPGISVDGYSLIMLLVLILTLVPAIGLIVWYVYHPKRAR